MQTAALAQASNVQVIRCRPDHSMVEVLEGAPPHPVRLLALTPEGRVVELLLSPSYADMLGRALCTKALEALPLWRPR